MLRVIMLVILGVGLLFAITAALTALAPYLAGIVIILMIMGLMASSLKKNPPEDNP